MMTETTKDFYGYARGDGYQAVDVPYSWGVVNDDPAARRGRAGGI